MNFPFFIAKRYFTTKENSGFVHIISWVSLFGIAIGTAALILVLSVFNGFENLVLSMYNSFDPHLKITSTEGKTFNPNEAKTLLLTVEEIEISALVLEEKVLLKYQEKEYIATAKGVSEEYLELTNFSSVLIEGEYINGFESNNVAVVGRGVAYYLSMGIGSMFEQLNVFMPNRNNKTLLNLSTAFEQSAVLPVGIFGVQVEVDAAYIITPLLFVQQLAERNNEVSSIEIKLKDEGQMIAFQEQLQKVLGPNYMIKNRIQQQEFLYKILNTEKLAVFLILTFIMIIATFNIIGSLSMLMLDKKKDIATLRSLGCKVQDIQSLFFKKSMLTIILGTGIGLFIGLGLAFLQQTFGFISMGGGSFVINTYPIAIAFKDVLLVSVTVFIIGLLASWYPAKLLGRKLFKN
ncbi:MAG: FtsX-like permease family protein [Flavobacteriales bacterium]|jgi:lipoprotein-releasing system permease protein|nr:FtsX-like permease family protein [Flavobacteriales bacterium]MBT5749922.1 FtsX-like permease family protein [Flavobacteriales bacterium]